jgi:acyl carrier protein
MTEQQVLDVLREFITAVTDGVSPDAVVPEATFDTLDLDSLSILEVMVSCEDRLGIRVLRRTAPEMTTVGDAIAYLTAEKHSHDLHKLTTGGPQRID